jgi:hypothetical protein
MGINDYLEASKKAKRLEDTLLFNIRYAILAAEATTKNQAGEISLAGLNEQAGRDAYMKALFKPLLEDTLKYQGISSNAQRDVFKDAELLHGRYGFTQPIIAEFIEENKDNTTFDTLLKRIYEYVKPQVANIRNAPMLTLKAEDASLVVSHTKLSGKVDHQKLTLTDMAQIINVYEQLGVVPPKFLEDKPYKSK